MGMLRDGQGDALFIYPHQVLEFSQCNEGSWWNCTLWEGFGTEYAFVQTGQFGYMNNGTTLVMAPKNSGLPELLRPCIAQFLETKEYYDLCEKYSLTADCYTNSFFPLSSHDESPLYNRPTNEQTGTNCTNGYCPCSL